MTRLSGEDKWSHQDLGKVTDYVFSYSYGIYCSFLKVTASIHKFGIISLKRVEGTSQIKLFHARHLYELVVNLTCENNQSFGTLRSIPAVCHWAYQINLRQIE